MVSLLRIYPKGTYPKEALAIVPAIFWPTAIIVQLFLCPQIGPGESKPLQEVDTGVGPGRLVVLNQPILLNDAIEKLKNHLKLPHLRLAVGVSVDRGKTFMLSKYWFK